MSYKDYTLAHLFAEHCRVLLQDTSVNPHERIDRVIGAAKELREAVLFPRPQGRPSNASKEMRMVADPFLTPILEWAKQKQATAVKALAAGDDPVAPYVKDLMERGPAQDGGG